jgi:hypothetical protein
LFDLKIFKVTINKRMQATNLYAVVDGFPGSGKSFIRAQIEALGYVTGDIDDFSQKALEEEFDDCDDFKVEMIDRVAREIYQFLCSKAGEKVVLVGVSSFMFDADAACRFEVATCSKECRKLWLDISPQNFTPPPGYEAHDPEFLEATRRAVIREFRLQEAHEWRSMSKKARKEEGKFWELPAPGEKGAPLQAGIENVDFLAWLHMPLEDFITGFPYYFNAMLDVMIEDNVSENRILAFQRGFLPLTPHAIVAYLDKMRAVPRQENNACKLIKQKAPAKSKGGVKKKIKK